MTDEVTQTAPETGGGEVSDAGNIDFVALFDGADKNSEPAKPQQDNAEANGEPEAEPEGEIEAGTEESDAGEEPAPPEAEEADVEGENAVDEKGKRYSLADGTKVTFNELRDGYLRQQDYSKKTAELAERVKAETAKIEQQRLVALQDLNQKLQIFDPVPRLMQQLQEAHEIGDVEMVTKLRLDIREAQDAQRFYGEQLAQAEYKKEQEDRQADAEHVRKHQKMLMEKFPFLKDKTRAASFNEVATNAFKKAGFTAEDLAGERRPDSRVAALAYYAGLYLKSQESRPQVAEAIKGKVIVPKPGARHADGGKGAQKQDALRRFSQNPNGEGSLAAALNALDF